MITLNPDTQRGINSRSGGCGHPLRKALWRGWIRLLSRVSRLRRREPADLW